MGFCGECGHGEGSDGSCGLLVAAVGFACQGTFLGGEVAAAHDRYGRSEGLEDPSGCTDMPARHAEPPRDRLPRRGDTTAGGGVSSRCIVASHHDDCVGLDLPSAQLHTSRRGEFLNDPAHPRRPRPPRGYSSVGAIRNGKRPRGTPSGDTAVTRGRSARFVDRPVIPAGMRITVGLTGNMNAWRSVLYCRNLLAIFLQIDSRNRLEWLCFRV